MVIKKQPEAVEEIVGGAIAQMAGRSPGREIQVEVPEEVLMVPMDARLIMQVLINLLDNAVKHTPPEAEIKITVKKDLAGENAVFCVADRGEGIAPEDLPRIFEKGYTGCNGRADKRSTGIGLYLCRQIMEKLSHTIRIESEMGVGTKVYLGLDTVSL